MFGKNKKEKAIPALPPIDDVEYEEEDEDDEEEEEEEEYVEVRPRKKKKKFNTSSLPEIEPPTPEEEELTEEKVKSILQNHEARLQKLEYHLRL